MIITAWPRALPAILKVSKNFLPLRSTNCDANIIPNIWTVPKVKVTTSVEIRVPADSAIFDPYVCQKHGYVNFKKIQTLQIESYVEIQSEI